MKLVERVLFNEIEKVVSSYLDKQWYIISSKVNEVPAMHDTRFLEGEGFNVFVKVGNNPFSFDQFTQESLGLRHITEHSGVVTPRVIDVLNVNDTTLLIMEAIKTKPVDTNEAWETLGRGLAKIHQATWVKCGLDTHSYLGIFLQDNRPMDSWSEFYGERRLRVQMKMAIDAGNMSYKQCKQVEALIERLPKICGPNQSFSLLHGDPWPGNLLYDGEKLVAIDCGIYYGNREIDLSTVDFFYPVSKVFFDAYNEVYPIEPGYEERKDLWKVNQWLGHVTLFGEAYIPKLMDAIKKYL